MWWSSLVPVVFLATAIISHPISSDIDSVKLLEDKQDFNTSLLTSEVPPEQETSPSRKHSKRSNDIKDVLRALNLPEDFAEPRSASDQSASSVTPPPNLSSTNFPILTNGPIQLNQNITSSSSTFPSLSSLGLTTNASRISALAKLLIPIAVTLPTAGPFAHNEDVDEPSRETRQDKYGTGNAMLDKIMNCPCAKAQLDEMGVKPVKYSNQPDPAIYRDPPYGMEPDNIGPGDLIATNLKNVGGSTGNVFGQILRLILGLPSLAISVLKPLFTGLADTWAQTTEAAGEVAGATAKSLPVTIKTAALVLKRVLSVFGDVTGALLNLVANLIITAGAAKTSFAGTLPFIFDGLNDMTSALGGQVTAAVDLVSGITDILSGGVVNAGKTGGNIFSGLIEGSKGFTNGLLNGIKYGVNAEELPEDQGGKRKRRTSADS